MCVCARACAFACDDVGVCEDVGVCVLVFVCVSVNYLSFSRLVNREEIVINREER